MSERLLEDDIAQLLENDKLILEKLERFEETLRGFMAYTKTEATPKADVDALSGLEQRLKDEINVSADGDRYALKRFLADRNDWITINNHLRAKGFAWTKNGMEGYWKR